MFVPAVNFEPSALRRWHADCTNSVSRVCRRDTATPTGNKENAMVKLAGKRIAILATDGVEESELTSPREALLEAGAAVDLIAPGSREIKAWSKKSWSGEYHANLRLDEAKASDYDALVLPGGVINPDALRTNEKAVSFVREFVERKKPIGAICHGPWTLINADGVRGKRLTSWPSLRKDLENAGADWEDAEVVVDQGLVTSRKPDDLPAFNRKLIEEVCEGRHA
jgi:protease I